MNPAPDSPPPNPNASPSLPETPSPLSEVAWVFLKLGTTAFGGPAAHIALMQDEIVRRRKWVTPEEFLDLLGAVHLIPGPNSTELALHLGHRRAGWTGFLVAGLCFILPAALIVAALAAAYVRFGTLPDTRSLLAGVQPVVLAVLAHALLHLGRSTLHNPRQVSLALLALAAGLVGLHELGILAGAALLALALRPRAHPGPRSPTLPALALPPAAAPESLPQMIETTLPAGVPAAAAALTLASPGLGPIFAVFLKVGSVLFGSGYVLLAFLRSDLVERRGWLTESQLLDAVAVGQFTPGPFFTTATFIGYLLGGGPGAVVATVGIFLPAFVFVALSGPLIPRLRQSPSAAAVLDGINVASLALMAGVTVTLALNLLHAPLAIFITGGSLLLLHRFRVNAATLVLAGAVLGWLSGRLPS